MTSHLVLRATMLMCLLIPSSSYAQAWTTNGMAVSMAANDQVLPSIVSDGSGGAIIFWQEADERLIAQHLNADGEKLWNPQGLVICQVGSIPTGDIRVVTDGGGGALISWFNRVKQDSRIRMQHVDSMGNLLFGKNGRTVLEPDTAAVHEMRMISDGLGGAILVWAHESGNYAQRISGSGKKMWADSGVRLFSDEFPRTDPEVISDKLGGAIVTGMFLSSNDNVLIVIQQLDAKGRAISDPIVLTETASRFSDTCMLASSGAGKAIVVWVDVRNGSELSGQLYAQRYGDGALEWGTGLLIYENKDHHAISLSAITTDANKGATIAWEDYTDDGLYARRIDFEQSENDSNNADPVPSERAASLPIAHKEMGSFPVIPRMIPDEIGSTIMAWQEVRSPGLGAGAHIYAQRVDQSGPSWTENARICRATAFEYFGGNMVACSDGKNGAIVAWVDSRNADLDIYAQKIGQEGEMFWLSDGVDVCDRFFENCCDITSGDIARAGSRGLFSAWSTYNDIHVQELDDYGNILWSGTFASSGDLLTLNTVRIVPDGKGAILLYDEENPFPLGARLEAALNPALEREYCSSSRSTIRALRVSKEVLNRPSNGVIVSSSVVPSELGEDFACIPDAQGGAIIAWSDNRFGSCDIYAQRIGRQDSLLWQSGGVPIGLENSRQITPAMVSDDPGGAIIAWVKEPERDEDNGFVSGAIVVQRVDSLGNTLWASRGVPLGTAGLRQTDLKMVRDGNGGAIIAWYEYACAGIVAQGIDGNGSILWDPNGVKIAKVAHRSRPFQMALMYPGSSDLTPSFIIAWIDNYRGNWGIYARIVSLDVVNQDGFSSKPEQFARLTKIPSDRNVFGMAANASGDIVLAFSDIRKGQSSIYFQHYTYAPLYPLEGRRISPQRSDQTLVKFEDADFLDRDWFSDSFFLMWSEKQAGSDGRVCIKVKDIPLSFLESPMRKTDRP